MYWIIVLIELLSLTYSRWPVFEYKTTTINATLSIEHDAILLATTSVYLFIYNIFKITNSCSNH